MINLLVDEELNEVKLVCSNVYNDVEALISIKLNDTYMCDLMLADVKVIEDIIFHRMPERYIPKYNIESVVKYLRNKFNIFLKEVSIDKKVHKYEALALMRCIAKYLCPYCISPIASDKQLRKVVLIGDFTKEFQTYYNIYDKKYRL